jgi:hypothetical protein
MRTLPRPPRFGTAVLGIVAALLFGCQTVPVDVTGVWNFEVVYDRHGNDENFQTKLDLRQLGTAVSGTWTALASDKMPIEGTVDHSNITLNVQFKLDGSHDFIYQNTGVEGIAPVYEGKLVGPNTMKGSVNTRERGNGKWSATRQPNGNVQDRK